MNRTDSVFFFVLVDFLVQVLFVGLVLYSLNIEGSKKTQAEQSSEAAKVRKLLERTGFSNLIELTDALARMGPIAEVQRMGEVLKSSGSISHTKTILETVHELGGIEAVARDVAKLRRIEEGSGKPPCLYSEVSGRRVVKPLATVRADDAVIEFTYWSDEMSAVLDELGLSKDRTRRLDLNTFRRTFAPLASLHPNCRYTLRFEENTRFVDARDAAQVAFYLTVVKR